MNFAAIFGLGPMELLIIAAVVVILFLPALLPKITRRSVETFKVMKQMTNHLDGSDEDVDDGED